MLKTYRLTYQYPGRDPFHFPDMDCAVNEHALILGPSGVGKTTLLHLLGGILNVQHGEIHIGQTPIHELRGSQLDTFRGKHIGIVFQKPHFIKSLTVIENILLTQSLAGTKADKSKALHLLERLGIASRAESNTYDLSVGEQQRLAIARAVINHPDIILADEPTSALDDENCFRTIQLLTDVANENNANLIIVTHDARIKSLIDKKILLN